MNHIALRDAPSRMAYGRHQMIHNSSEMLWGSCRIIVHRPDSTLVFVSFWNSIKSDQIIIG
jgi:hypothetical protein